MSEIVTQHFIIELWVADTVEQLYRVCSSLAVEHPANVTIEVPWFQRLLHQTIFDEVIYKWNKHQVWHVLNEGSHSFAYHNTFIQKWNEPYLPLTPNSRTSQNFGWYSFSFPLRVGGWVSLVYLGEILRWFALPKTVTHPSICRGGRELNPRPSSRESNHAL